MKENVIFLFGGKSTTKKVYSVDAGAIVTEYQAMLCAINYYLGDYAQQVIIIKN